MPTFLQSVHFYRRVPQDLSQGTNLGGALSLCGAVIMVSLFFSNLTDYLKMSTTTDIQVDQVYDDDIMIKFNITMHRVPCHFTSLDIADVMGTQLQNISEGIHKFRVDSTDQKVRYKPHKVEKQHQGGPQGAPMQFNMSHQMIQQLTEDNFDEVVAGRQLTMVLYGTTWCTWTQGMLPIWLRTKHYVNTMPYSNNVEMATVDCAHPKAASLCLKQHVESFPTIRVFSSRNPQQYENYIGERSQLAILNFIKAFTEGNDPKTWESLTEAGAKGAEGCEMSGSLAMSRVPGNFRISAFSAYHSFNPQWINISHSVNSLSFGVPTAKDKVRVMQTRLLAQHEHMSRQEMEESRERIRKLLTDITSGQERTTAQAESRIHSVHAEDAHGPDSLSKQKFITTYKLATVEHYLKVIPTTYAFFDGVNSDAYTYTVNNRESVKGYTPTAIFSYDISPMRVVMSQSKQSLSQFLTQVCAVLGGVFTMTGLVDGLIYHTSASVGAKMRLGKNS